MTSASFTSSLFSSRLTADEVRMYERAEIDLGVGYPVFAHQSEASAKWAQSGLSDIVDAFEEWAPERHLGRASAVPSLDRIQRNLLLQVCSFLGLDSKYARNAFVVPSGSLALDRAISALAGTRPGSAVTTEPSIDIIPAMISERGVPIRYVESPPPRFTHDAAGILSAADVDCSFVVLSSPENPSGTVMGADALSMLAAELRLRGIPLLVDQCFAMVTPFEPVPLLAPLSRSDGGWIMVWDTGKMFDFFDQKLGFIFCSSDLADLVRRRVEVLQCTLPRRPLLEFFLILGEAMRTDFVTDLGGKVASNIGTIQRALMGTSVGSIRPQAGGFMLLDVSELRKFHGSEDLASRAREEESLGLIAGTRFYHSSDRGDNYLRVALARDEVVIREGMRRLRRLLI